MNRNGRQLVKRVQYTLHTARTERENLTHIPHARSWMQSDGVQCKCRKRDGRVLTTSVDLTQVAAVGYVYYNFMSRTYIILKLLTCRFIEYYYYVYNPLLSVIASSSLEHVVFKSKLSNILYWSIIMLN